MNLMIQSFSLFLTVKTIWKLNTEHSRNSNNSPCCPHSPDNTKFEHFMLLFCRGGKEIYEDL